MYTYYAVARFAASPEGPDDEDAAYRNLAGTKEGRWSIDDITGDWVELSTDATYGSDEGWSDETALDDFCDRMRGDMSPEGRANILSIHVWDSGERLRHSETFVRRGKGW